MPSVTVHHLASASLYAHMNANARGTTHITTCAHALHSTPASAVPRAAIAWDPAALALGMRGTLDGAGAAGAQRGKAPIPTYSITLSLPSGPRRARAHARRALGPALPRERTACESAPSRPGPACWMRTHAIGRHATPRHTP